MQQFEELKKEDQNFRHSLREKNKQVHDSYFDLLQNPKTDSVEINNKIKAETK